MAADLSVPVLIAVNVMAWLAIHLGLAWLGTRLPAGLFDPASWPYRSRTWERGGRLYQRLFAVRSWKGLLPDGAAMFAGGFPKASLREMSEEYLRRFIVETCRGEAVHWAVLLCSPLFFLWNPRWAGLVMVAYGLAANLPCIIVQRYNRARLRRLLRAM